MTPDVAANDCDGLGGSGNRILQEPASCPSPQRGAYLPDGSIDATASIVRQVGSAVAMTGPMKASATSQTLKRRHALEMSQAFQLGV